MKNKIDKAILHLKYLNLEPRIINLTNEDYKIFSSEIELMINKDIDWGDGYIKNIEFYNGVEIDQRCLDEDEAEKVHPLLSKSFISSATEILGLLFYLPEEPLTGKIRERYDIKYGRMFNIETLTEII